MGVVMTTTGPMPVLKHPTCCEDRQAILQRMGAHHADRFTRYHFPTADAVIDPERGILFIAVDIDPDPADWSAVVGLIRAVGFTDGELPHRRDPGEPEFHGLEAVYTWRLEYVSLPDDSGCIWCDGNGCSGGCPLCGKGAVRLVLTTEPLALDLSLGPGALLRLPPA